MARFIYQGFTQDANGKIVVDCNVTVYEANTTTLATIYSAYAGGSAISGSTIVSSSTTGYYGIRRRRCRTVGFPRQIGTCGSRLGAGCF